jgi:hypothetical protein
MVVSQFELQAKCYRGRKPPLIKEITMRMWIYHPTKEPKIIDSELFCTTGEWKDSPDFSLGDIEENTESIQSVGQSVKKISEVLNNDLNLEEMNKKDLVSHGKHNYGLNVKQNMKKSTIINTIKEHTNDRS